MLLHNPFFWLGQLGLILIMLSAALLTYRLRSKTRLLTGPIWLLAFLTLSILVNPAKYALTMPTVWFLFELSIGLVITGVTWFMIYAKRNQMTPAEKQVSKNIVKWGATGSLLLLSYLIWKVKQLAR